MSESQGSVDWEPVEEDGKPLACNMEVLEAFLVKYERLDNFDSEIDTASIDAKDVGLDIDIGGVWAGDDANELCYGAAKSSGHSSVAELPASKASPSSNFRKDVGASANDNRIVKSPPAAGKDSSDGTRPREDTSFVSILPASPHGGGNALEYKPVPKPKRGPYRDNWPRESTTQTPYQGYPFGWGSTIHPTMCQNQHQETFKERWVTVSAHCGEVESDGELEHQGI
jgi:hypothetical protein